MKVINYFSVVALLLMASFSVWAAPSSGETALSNGSVKIPYLIVPTDTAPPASRTGTNPDPNWMKKASPYGLDATGTGTISAFANPVVKSAKIIQVPKTEVTVSQASPPPVACVTTTTFSFTGAMQTFTVPAGITSISIETYGAEGGTGANGNSNAGATLGGVGGRGSKAVGTLSVTPGQVLNIFVGGAGATPTSGFNGGGTGGNQNSGGGGGASDIRFPGSATANRILVAAGGGGGGRGGCESSAAINGGAGGSGDGNGGNGSLAPTIGGNAGGGFGAIGSAFGAKGIGCANFSGIDGIAGSATGLGGNGGSGQSCCCFSFGSIPGGGGGGGGFGGGGGGGGGSAGTVGCSGNDKGGGGGGAGGSSYTSGVAAGAVTTNVQLGNGLVIISFNNIPPVLSNPVITNVTCNGGSDGKVVVSATGGTPPVSFSIAPNVGTQSPSGTFTGLTAQTYTVTATDAAGCTASKTAVVTQNPPVVIVSLTKVDVTCPGGNDGKISGVASGGSGSGTYSISPNVGTQSGFGVFTGLTAQTYVFTATDGNGCTKSSSIVVGTTNTASTAPTSISGVTAICLGSSTTLTLVGGIAGTGATAQWFTGSCGGTPAGTGNSITVAPTVTTTYFVRYSGICNTTACASVTVVVSTPSVGGTLAPANSQVCGPTAVNLSLSGNNGAVTQWERQANCAGAWVSIGSAGLTSITTITPNQTSCYRVAVTNGACPTVYSTTATVIVDKPAVGGRVTLQSNMLATSVALCPGENAILVPKNYVGKVVLWQYSYASSPIWYDLPGSAGLTSLTINGSSIGETVYYRTVICTELGICTGYKAVAYSSAFRINKKLICPLPDGSITNTGTTMDKGFTLVKTYPNPATNLVTLEIDSYTEGVAQLEILDVTGRQVLKQTTSLTEGLNTISVDVSPLSRGIFIVKMTDSQNQKSWVKMVKE